MTGERRAAAWVVELGSAARPVRLRGGERALLAAVARACGAAAPRRPADAVGAVDGRTAKLDLTSTSRTPPLFELSGEGLPTRAARSLGEVLFRLEELLDLAAARRPGPPLLLHASAVVTRGGRAILLAGPSGAGKSTAAVLLALSGDRWLGDECLPLHVDPPAVERCRRPVALRPDVLQWAVPLVARGAAPALLDGGGKRFWSGPGLPRSRAAGPVPLSALVLLDGGEERGGPLDPGAALAQCLPCCHLFQQRGAESFRALADLCRALPAFRIAARGGTEFPQRLRRLLARSRRSAGPS